MSSGAYSDEDNALAGEYVLGVLPTDARRAAEQRIASDANFASLVASWQSELSTLDDGYVPESPPAGVKARIDAQLFAGSSQPSAGLWGSLVFWRTLTAAAVAAAIVLAVVDTGLIDRLSGPEQRPMLVAELGAEGSAVGLVAALDPESGVLAITPAAFSPDDGKALELWLVPGEGAPVSLGLVPGDGGRLVIDQGVAGRLSAGALIAVSIEPEGGSPTGAPTGPVVLSGALSSS